MCRSRERPSRPGTRGRSSPRGSRSRSCRGGRRRRGSTVPPRASRSEAAASHAWWETPHGFQLVRAVIGDKRAEDAAGSDRAELVWVPNNTSLASACSTAARSLTRSSVRAIPVSSRITTLWRSRIIGEVLRSRS